MAADSEITVNEKQLRPLINGLSPKEGIPGTQIKIRGENLGNGQSDLLVLSICGTDCLMSAKWKSPSLIVARVGQAKRGVGEIILVTKSLGRSVSTVTFRVFVVQVGPLEESAVWVDESRTVPGREAVRNIPETIETVDALGLRIEPQKKMEQSILMQMFPEGSGNLRMENFNPAWFLLENHQKTRLSDLHCGLNNLKKSVNEEDSNADVHRANLYALISCVDALAACHTRLQLEKNTRGWPLTQGIFEKLDESSSTANGLFYDVLSRKDRADATRNALSVLTRFRFIFFLSGAINSNLSKGEYSTILNDYARAKSLFKDTDVPLFKEGIMDVLDAKMEIFKKSMKKRLIDMPTSFEDQSKLIKYLKVLEPDSDPAWDCITAYHCWLEDLLWQTQFKHYEIVVEGRDHSRLEFVEAVVNIITDKLQIFWKLSQVYSASSTNQNYVDRQFDINQMLVNTINVSSWLMLNALVPSSLPEAVISQYKEQFVEWPDVAFKSLTNQLFFSLKILRNCVSSMLDSNFTTEHLQPLIELSITIRLKCLSNIIEKTSQVYIINKLQIHDRFLKDSFNSVDGQCKIGFALDWSVASLTAKENWNLEIMPNNNSKTVLPDLFETELNDSLPSIKQILSYSGFCSELDLFSRETFRPILTSLFTSMITSVRDCIRQLLQFRDDSKRPSDLNSNKVSSKKLLISVCNVEYIINNSLPSFCRRLSENGVKYGDSIFEQSKTKLTTFRKDLLKWYLQLKCAAFSSLIDSANYNDLPYEDASDYVKELLMCLVFIQSEVCLFAPHLDQEILAPPVQTAFNELLSKLSKMENLSGEQATQLVVDVTALEESLQNFLSLETRAALNAFRARLIETVDSKLVIVMGVGVYLMICGCLYFTAHLLTPSFTTRGHGYTVGNRHRMIAVFKLELEMLPLSVLAFLKINSFLSSVFGKKLSKKSSSSPFKSNKDWQSILIYAVLLWLSMAHMGPLLFYMPPMLRNFIACPANLSLGFWTYFVPILFGFWCCTCFLSFCVVYSFGKKLVQILFSSPLLKKFLCDGNFQFKIVTFLSITLSVLTYISGRHLFIKEISLAISNLPEEAKNIRFALISDLHAGGCVDVKRISQVVDAVNSENVDAVFIVGDAVDGERSDLFSDLEPLQFLRAKYGTFFVSGNHEYYYGDAMEWFREFKKYGITVLDNRHVNLSGICLVGVNDYSSKRSGIEEHKFDPSKALEGCDPGRPIIVLSHNPASAPEIVSNSQNLSVDLILSGHTHAGQFYTMAPIVYWFLPYFHGLYNIAKRTQLFVTAGTLYQGPPMKMITFSEIWIITLNSS